MRKLGLLEKPPCEALTRPRAITATGERSTTGRPASRESSTIADPIFQP